MGAGGSISTAGVVPPAGGKQVRGWGAVGHIICIRQIEGVTGSHQH